MAKNITIQGASVTATMNQGDPPVEPFEPMRATIKYARTGKAYDGVILEDGAKMIFMYIDELKDILERYNAHI